MTSDWVDMRNWPLQKFSFLSKKKFQFFNFFRIFFFFCLHIFTAYCHPECLFRLFFWWYLTFQVRRAYNGVRNTHWFFFMEVEITLKPRGATFRKSDFFTFFRCFGPPGAKKSDFLKKGQTYSKSLFRGNFSQSFRFRGQKNRKTSIWGS